jgi:hypothetical protein
VLSLVAILLAQLPPQAYLEPANWQGAPSSANAVLQVCPNNSCPNPLTGSKGEAFTFTRASAATCPNNDGSIQTLSSGQICEPAATFGGGGTAVRIRPQVQNLAQYSSSIGTSPWTTVNLVCSAPTVTTGSTDLLDPNGGNAASKVVFPACSGGAGNYTVLYQPYTATAAAYSHGIYARTLSGSYTLNVFSSPNADTSGLAVTCTAVSTKWTLCPVVNVTETAATWNLQVGYDGTYSGTGSPQTAISAGTVYLYGAQAALGTSLADLCQSAGGTATCLAEALASNATPSGLSTSAFCFSDTVVNPWTATSAILAGGTYGGANSWNMYYGGGQWFWTVYDASDNYYYWTATQALVANTSYHVRLCYSGPSPTPTFSVNGVSQTVTLGGSTGTGILGSQGVLSIANLGSTGDQSNGNSSSICLGNGGVGSGACP